MFADIDLRKLTEYTSPDRCFLSLYIENRKSIKNIEQRIEAMSKILNKNADKDERDHLKENWELVKKHLANNPPENGSICIFACWLLGFFKVYPLSVNVPDLVWIDSSPYVRPLAELQDEYENVAVVIADNKTARIFVVSSAVAMDEETVHGNVKNHVRKGGWSQQRYERRRDKQLQQYSREIIQVLQSIEKEEKINHILLVGGKEILRGIYEDLPKSMQDKTVQKRSDINKGDASVNDDIWDLFRNVERESESDLWARIQREYLANGLGTVGVNNVHKALQEGRVEKMIVCRDLKQTGARCRDCNNLFTEVTDVCSVCSSNSLFEVDVINELVEMVIQQGGETDFVDPIDTLEANGCIAALLRY